MKRRVRDLFLLPESPHTLERGAEKSPKMALELRTECLLTLGCDGFSRYRERVNFYLLTEVFSVREKRSKVVTRHCPSFHL